MKPSLILVTTSLLLASCASNSAPPRALDAVYSAYERDRVAHYKQFITNIDLAATANGAAARNDIMNDLVLMIDHRYADIERGLYDRKSWADFGGSVIATGLGTAGTLVGGEGIKTTLSALVTAIDSTKVSFNKDILQGQGIIAIIATMRKMRAEKLLQIRYSQKLPISAYPLSLGIDDLMAYYQAGTFIGALQAMTEDAAAGKKIADAQLDSLKTRGAIPSKVVPPGTSGPISPPTSGSPAGTSSSIPAKATPPPTNGVVPGA